MSHSGESIYYPTAPVKPHRRALQISIRTLLIATAIVAAIIGLSLAPPIAAVLLAVTHATLLGCALIAAISGRGWIRPFAIIFAIYLSGLAFFAVATHLPGPGAFAIFEVVNFLIATVISTSGAVFHSYLVKRNGYLPAPNLPFLRKWLANETELEIAE